MIRLTAGISLGRLATIVTRRSRRNAPFSVVSRDSSPYPEGYMKAARRILFADDDPDVQRALKRLAEKNGFELLPVLAGADVYQAALESRPDLIVLDIHFPDADGRDVLSRLKADPRIGNIPVVVWSGRDPESDRRIALDL